MREILFRGKRLNGDGWVYGDLSYHAHDGEVYVFPGDGYDSPDCYEVDPATIGQYTGLTDKNGVKIFEGDICDFTVFDCLDNDTQYRGVVVYAGSRFMLWKSEDNEYYGADGGFDLDWVVAQDDEFEIIGNIHDNPELLRGGFYRE